MLEDGRFSDNMEMLTCFGLTRQEAKIYLLLLTEGALSGYEASKRAGISRSNAYGALAGLVDKGAACLLEEQSTPQPSSFKIFRMAGVGVAFTAKYSRNPLFQENALYRFRAVSRIPFSSYRWNGVGYFLTISSNCSFVTNGFFSIFSCPFYQI